MSETFFFTFGVGHALARYYVELRGSRGDTREEMFRLFGNKWSFQYDNVRGRELLKKYDYLQLHCNSPMCTAGDNEVIG